MRVIVRQKNLEITPALAEFVEKKLVEPLRKRLKNFKEKELPLLEIEIGRSTRHHKKGRVYRAEANLSLGKKLFRAEADEEDVRVACDVLKDELLEEIAKYKSKQQAACKKGGRRAKQALVRILLS